MNYDAFKVWIDIAQFLITGAIGVYIYLVNKNDATNARIAGVETRADTRLDDHETRLATLEATIAGLPTHNDLSELNGKISALQRETSGQTEILKALNKQVDRITDFLLERK